MFPMIFFPCFFVPQTSEETLRGRKNRNSSLFLLFWPLAAKTFDTDGVPNLVGSFSELFDVHLDSVDIEISSLVTVLWSYYVS